MIVILMGVVGSGKTTVGKLLAEQLEWEFADADERDVGVVLRDDDALVIGAGGDLDEDSAAGTGKGVMIHGVLDGGEDDAVFVAGDGVRGGGIDADVDVLRVCGKRKEQERKRQASEHES